MREMIRKDADGFIRKDADGFLRGGNVNVVLDRLNAKEPKVMEKLPTSGGSLATQQRAVLHLPEMNRVKPFFSGRGVQVENNQKVPLVLRGKPEKRNNIKLIF